jgi:DNA-binding response OmpR family regulator
MKKILIIEDESAYMRILSDKLTGYEILTATDGKKGLRLALKQKPDLILLDIKMPMMDGMTVLEELRRNTYGKTAKVIILTNFEASSAIIEKVTKHLPISYFVKSDIKLNDLLKKIKVTLEDSELRRI